jgi:hypothetical protein
MLAYGLFLARLNSDSEPVTLHNARQYIPGSFRLIRESIDFLTELEKGEHRDVRWVVEEVLSIVNNLDLRSIHEDLSFRGRAIALECEPLTRRSTGCSSETPSSSSTSHT